MMTPICPRLLNMNTYFVLLRFRARAPDDLGAKKLYLLLLLLLLRPVVQTHHPHFKRSKLVAQCYSCGNW